MTKTISQQEYEELFKEKLEDEQNSNQSSSDVTWKHPEQLGQGYWRSILLGERIELAIADYQLHEHLIVTAPEREHPLEYAFYLSGSHWCNNKLISAEQYAFWGSGIAPKEVCESSAQRITFVNVHLEPEVFCSFISEASGQIAPQLQQLVRRCDREYYVCSGTTTAAMQIALQQILHCPYQGLTRRIYLQGKVFELLALLLEPLLAEQTQRQPRKLKPEDIERIHHAKDILLNRLEHPPSLVELAREAGINDYKLKIGFHQVFGTTVFGYLNEYRMERSRQLLQEGNLTVTGVARAVGYANRSHFAAAFKRKFGVNPGIYLH